MPTRVLYSTLLTSSKVNRLKPDEFELYIRLILVADDHGRYSGSSIRISRSCWPDREDITSKKIDPALQQLHEIGLIYLYHVNGDRYLEITNWNQRKRTIVSKFPSPGTDVEPNDSQMPDECQSNDRQKTARDERRETRDENIRDERRETRSVKADTKSNIDFQAVVDYWNDIVSDLPKVVSLTEQRKKAIKSIWMKAGDSPLWTFATAFRDVQDSDFLSGRNGQWSGCGFDWVMKPANWTKIIEGNYRNKTGKSHAPPHEDIGHYAPDPDWLTGGNDG